MTKLNQRRNFNFNNIFFLLSVYGDQIIFALEGVQKSRLNLE